MGRPANRAALVAMLSMIAAGAIPLSAGGLVNLQQARTAPPADNPAQPTSLHGAAGALRRQFPNYFKSSGRRGFRNWPPRTVAQDKRDARKARNRRQQKR